MDDIDTDQRFTPTEEEKKQGMICKNAVQCSICGSSADRYTNLYQCQKNPSHLADTFTGIFSNHSVN